LRVTASVGKRVNCSGPIGGRDLVWRAEVGGKSQAERGGHCVSKDLRVEVRPLLFKVGDHGGVKSSIGLRNMGAGISG